jgi:hypothetical protein
MRLVLALMWLCLAYGTAVAEIRTFVLSNDADGYGVDRCLATGASCGNAVASAYCRSVDFSEARSFRTLASEEKVESQVACLGSCGELVAIECMR